MLKKWHMEQLKLTYFHTPCIPGKKVQARMGIDTLKSRNSDLIVILVHVYMQHSTRAPSILLCVGG